MFNVEGNIHMNPCWDVNKRQADVQCIGVKLRNKAKQILYSCLVGITSSHIQTNDPLITQRP